MKTSIQKQQIRMQCRKARQALDTAQRQEYSAAIAKHLQTIRAYQEAETIGSYISTDNEVNTSIIHTHCWENKKALLLPVIKDNKTLRFVHYTANNTLLKNKFGILEPQTNTQTRYVSHENIDCLLIPLVGFDIKGNRIGFGGGYYDKYLQNKTATTLCIGLAFEIQKIPPINKEKWDITMDIIITEEKIYSIKQE